MENSTAKKSTIVTWVIIMLLLVWVLVKGVFSFLAVGDVGQPTWDYRPVKDVPGESPYAIYEVLPYSQHVQGAKGE